MAQGRRNYKTVAVRLAAAAAVLLALVLWLVPLAWGLAVFWRYEAKPGARGAVPARWPTDTGIAFTPGRYNLLVFAHPKCPCTRATLGELAVLMAKTRGAATARVLFVRPDGFPVDWEQTDLWRSAAEIPGVRVSVDVGGVEARRFGSMTSGQVLLYDGAGNLAFDGGITASRGHSGDNAGRSAVTALIGGAPVVERHTPVFGCALGGGQCTRPDAESSHASPIIRGSAQEAQEPSPASGPPAPGEPECHQ